MNKGNRIARVTPRPQDLGRSRHPNPPDRFLRLKTVKNHVAPGSQAWRYSVIDHLLSPISFRDRCGSLRSPHPTRAVVYFLHGNACCRAFITRAVACKCHLSGLSLIYFETVLATCPAVTPMLALLYMPSYPCRTPFPFVYKCSSSQPTKHVFYAKLLPYRCLVRVQGNR